MTLRPIKFAWQNFFRNIWLSLITIIIIISSLFLVNTLVILGTLANQGLNFYKNKVDVSVFLKPEVTDQQVQNIKENLSKLSTIKGVEVKPKEQALEELKDEYQNNPILLKSLKELETNPLGEILIIKLNRIEDYSSVMSTLQTKDYQDVIETNLNKFSDIKEITDKLNNFAQKVYQIELIVSIIFSIIIFFLVFNTIRLTIYSHREEISIMRLVGASSWFIRGPFLIESIFYGFIAWLINLMILFPLSKILQPYISNFLDHYQFNLMFYFLQNFFQIFGWQLLIIICISMLSSAFAMRKYLKI